MKFHWMTLLLGALISIGPLSTDMYLASLPEMTHIFKVSAGTAQLTLSVYLFGWAICMLLVGPLSDYYGRRPVIIYGLIIYSLASIACVFAFNIWLLILLRLLQSFGASATTVVARAVVRDLYKGEHAAKMLSLMGASMALVPALAPILGGYFHKYFGWQSNFLFMAFFGFTELIVVLLFMKETLPIRKSGLISINRTFAQYLYLLKNKRYLGFCVCVSFGVAGSYTFVSSSSFVLQDLMGVSVDSFGYYFGAVVLGFMAGTLFGAKYTLKFGINIMMEIGVSLAAISGLTMLFFATFNSTHIATLIVPQIIYYFSIGIISPQGTAGALTLFAKNAGIASSLFSFFPVVLGSVVGAFATQAYNGTLLPMTLTIALMGCLAYFGYHFLLKDTS